MRTLVPEEREPWRPSGAMDDARGRKPGQSRNPKGGKPYKREYTGREGAEQLHGSREPDHEDEFGRVPAVLQRADGRGRGQPGGGGRR